MTLRHKTVGRATANLIQLRKICGQLPHKCIAALVGLCVRKALKTEISPACYGFSIT
jgi:hypothetical protein